MEDQKLMGRVVGWDTIGVPIGCCRESIEVCLLGVTPLLLARPRYPKWALALKGKDQMPPKKKEVKTVDLAVVERGQFEACLLGTTPIILNRMSRKARQQLLLPSGRKSEAEKKSQLKHDPLEEYRASAYTDKDPNGPTLLQIVAASVKLATASIPLDLPDTGTSKAQLERLLFAPEDRVALYGIPCLKMDVTRNSDMNHTPDIRTRACVRHWACKVILTYVKPVLKQAPVEKFLSAAGFMRGIGDWRPEKGSGNFGVFEVVSPDDPRFLEIIKHGGREAQIAAMQDPTFYDDETEEMFAWFCEERNRRGFDESGKKAEPSNGNGKGKRRRVELEEEAGEEAEEATE